jgi:DNA-binding LacI/PurR family transcriptional regulator
MQQLGAVAAEMLLKASAGRKIDERHVQLDTDLIIRQSSGVPRT